VLYELCTLEHAFLADNLLGLVYKIVKGNYDAIPDEYSDDLKDLVGKILNKDESQRPTVQEILLSPFLKAKMEDFITNKGNVGSTTLKVKTLPLSSHVEGKVQDDDDELMKNLTPAERMKLRKELKSKREAEEMKKAIKKNISSYGAAKERKFNEFHSSKDKGQLMKGLAEDEQDDDAADARGSSGRYYQFKVDPNSQTDFS
jgi:serine/threonine protein kinase